MQQRIKNTILFKTISLFLIFTFSFYNVTFSRELASSQVNKADSLSPVLNFAFSSNIVLNEDTKQDLKDWFKDIDKQGVLDKIGEATQKCVTQYLDKMKEKMMSGADEKTAHAEWMKVVKDDKAWGAIFSDFLGKYIKELRDQKISMVIRLRVQKEFDNFRTLAKEKAGLATRTPGVWYARTGKNQAKPLSSAERKAMDKAIKGTIEELKEKIAKEINSSNKEEIQKRFEENWCRVEVLTGVIFVVLPDAIYDKYAERFGAPLDVECHPGTRETRLQYERYRDFSSVKKFSYIRENSYYQLTESEILVLARHELKHIELALGKIKLSLAERRSFQSEEEWINNQAGCDARPIMARLRVLKKQTERFENIFRRNEKMIKREKAGIAIDGTPEGYYKIAKLFGEYVPFTAYEFAGLIDKDVEETKEILEELWLGNKKINHVKGFNNEIWYEWDPIGAVTIVSSRMTPKDIPVGAPMLVVIGHSEVRDYQDMGIRSIRAQRDLFQKAGYRIIGPWGDFPLQIGDVDYLKRRLRLFPVELCDIAAKTTAVDDDYREAIMGLSSEVNRIQRIRSIDDMMAHEEYDKYYGILEPLIREEFKNKKTDEEIKKILNDLPKVKRRIIKEVSTVYDINFQVRALFKGVPIKAVLYQFINPYEPIEGIRTVAIPKEVAQLRLEKMIPVFVELGFPDDITDKELAEVAKVLGLTKAKVIYRDILELLYGKKLKLLYGGGAQSDNIRSMVEAGYNGAFVARHIYTIKNAVSLAQAAIGVKEGIDLLYNFKAQEKGPWMSWIKGYKEAGVDLEKVNIFHCVSILHIDAAISELRGEGVELLFKDARQEKIKRPLAIDAMDKSIAMRGVGSNTGIIPAEFLAQAGVTHAIVDNYGINSTVFNIETQCTQIKNLIDAGIIPLIVYGPAYDLLSVKAYWKEHLNEHIDKIQFVQPYECPPITPINQVMQAHAEMAFSSEIEKGTAIESRSLGYYESVKEPKGVYQKITETIKSGAPLYLNTTLESSEYYHGSESIEGHIGTITLPMLKQALKYFPRELLGKDAIQENGIVLPESELQEDGGCLITIDSGKTFNLGKEPDFKNPGFHILVLVDGEAVVFVRCADGNWRSVNINADEEKGVVLIPASAKEVRIKTGMLGARVRDIFIPLPEQKFEIGEPFREGGEMPNTGIFINKETGVIKDFGEISEETDILTFNGELLCPPSMITHENLQRRHRLIVKSGAVEIMDLRGYPLLDESNSVAIFGPQEALDIDMDHKKGTLKFTSPDGRIFHFSTEPRVTSITDYWIKKSKFSETVIVEARYDKTEEEKAVYSVYEMTKNHVSLISQKKIDLIVPREMFRDSLQGEGSKNQAQKNLDELFGKGAIRIRDYASEAGLNQKDVENLLRSSLSLEKPNEARIPVLFAAESNIKAIQPKNYPMCSADLAMALDHTRILSIPDLEGLGGKGWLYALTVLRVGILQGCLTSKDIESAENGEKTLAQDMEKMMKAVTNRRDITIRDLFLMLSYKEIPLGVRVTFQIKDVVSLMYQALQRLLIGIPMDRIDESTWKDRMDKINFSA